MPDPVNESKPLDAAGTVVEREAAMNAEGEAGTKVEGEALPVLPRTSTISTTADDEALPVLPRTSTISATAPVRADAAEAASEPRVKRTTVEPATLREANKPADLISLPRTMSEEWMAADADDGAYEDAPKRPRWIFVLGGGVAVIGLVAVFALAGGKETAAPRSSAPTHQGSAAGGAPVAAVALDAANAVVTAVAPIDTAAVAITPIDAASVAEAVVDAPQVTVAPQVVVAPVHAAAVAVIAVDAGTAVAAVPVAAPPVAVAAAAPTKRSGPNPGSTVTTPPATTNAGSTVAAKGATKTDATVAANPAAAVAVKPAPKPVASTTPKKSPAAKETKAAEPPKDQRTIEQLVDAKEFATANAACTTNTQFSSPRLVACALAACNTHSIALATRWIRAIPRASRDELVAACKTLGVDVATP